MKKQKYLNHVIFLGIIFIVGGLVLIIYPFFNLPMGLFSCMIRIIVGFCLIMTGIYFITYIRDKEEDKLK